MPSLVQIFPEQESHKIRVFLQEGKIFADRFFHCAFRIIGHIHTGEDRSFARFGLCISSAEDLSIHPLLAAKVVIDHAFIHTRTLHDLIHGNPVVTAFGEQPPCRLQEPGTHRLTCPGLFLDLTRIDCNCLVTMSSVHASKLPCAPDQIDHFLSEPSAGVVETASAMKGPVGVLGAGGKMGLHVSAMIRKALDLAGRKDVPVYAVSRFGSVNSREEFSRFGVDTIAADLLDAAALSELPDLGTVFFLAGIKFGTGNDPDALRRYNEEMPSLVANRFRSAVTVALSTGCVYPFVGVDSAGSNENDAPSPSGDYAVSCRGREMAFENISRKTGTPVVLIRLNYSVEFRYGVLVDIAQKVLLGEPVDVSMGSFNAIWQRDAVDHIIRSSEVAANPAVPLNITGAPPLSVRSVAMEFGRLLDREPILTGCEESTAWLSNPTRAHSLFGAPEASYKQMMEWIAAWLLAGGYTHGKPTKFEVRDGKY